MKKKVLILGGGYSKERYISLKSAKAVFKSIIKSHTVKFADTCDNFLKIIENFKPDIIFNALHGRFGEDGYIQSILETLKVKYTHSGVQSSMKAMDKEISKKIFIKNKILTPKFIILKNKTYPVMITFSPSYLIRFPENKKFSWEDLKKIKEKIQDLNIMI